MDCSTSFNAKTEMVYTIAQYVFKASEAPLFACYVNGVGTCSVSKEWETLEPKAYYTEFCGAKSNCLDEVWPNRYYEVNVTFSDMFEDVDPTNCHDKF